MTSYTQYLFAVAEESAMADDVPPLPSAEDAGSWLCCFWKEMGYAMREDGGDLLVPTRVPLVPTRHGVDAVVDELFRHNLFQQTLGHATHIIDHFALSYLPTTPTAFRDLWTYVIVPAWTHHADVHRLTSS
jgi:hypothetical protein